MEALETASNYAVCCTYILYGMSAYIHYMCSFTICTPVYVHTLCNDQSHSILCALAATRMCLVQAITHIQTVGAKKLEQVGLLYMQSLKMIEPTTQER